MDEIAQRSLEEPGDSCGDSVHWPYDVHGTHTHRVMYIFSLKGHFRESGPVYRSVNYPRMSFSC